MSRRVREPETVPHVGGGWWLVHGLPLLAPGIGCLIWALIVQMAHLAWGGDPFVTPVLALLFFVLGGAVTYYGWLAAGSRRDLRIAVATSGAAATGVLVLGLIFGLTQGWLLSVYVICSIVVWVLWGIWRSSKYAGATNHDGEATPLLEAVKNAQVRFSAPTVDERGVVRAKVHTKPGGTLDDARALVPLLSSAARAVPGGAHLSAHPDKDGVATLEIPTRDNLKGRLAWPGVADLLGSLPTEAFAVAEYQSGPCTVRLIGDFDKDRGAEDIKHVKIGGVTRSGKSTGALVILASLLVMRRLNVIGVDLTKEMQTFGPVAHGLTWVITDVEEARLFMARLPKVIEGRTAQLAREGLRRWSLRSKLNLMVVWLEESKEFRRFQAQYEKVVADAGSAGIMFVSSTQDWIYRQVSTSVRKNHGAGICFGVEEAEDAAHVLPERAIAALGRGGMPTWGSTRPGYCYIAGLGIPESKWARMARFYDPLDEQLIEAVDLGAPYRAPMDDVTAGLFGELFSRRTVYRAAQWGQPVE
ncbi:FtsK/SpoIIIE domain-containing protein, partial [Streptosporangium sp. NPDC051022]|uniref:FtsK/SpoIIIE domain-containing protein n=1 Tax=Streptosporangium sp. NPDC051022 TaxID=3155752 RepID=UPI0034219301